MKILLALSLLLPAAASAIKPADGPSYDAIDALLRESRVKELTLLTLNTELRALKGSISRRPGATAADDDKDPVIRSKKDEIAKAIEERDLIMTRAIKATLLAYDIVPSRGGVLQMPRGVSAYSRNRGETIEFVPVYNPALGERHTVQSNTGAERLHGTKPNDKAYTAFNGSVILHKPVSGPRELALILFHERRHFEQYTSPALANLSYADKEVLAYADTLHVMGKIGYTVGSAEEKEMSGLLDAKRREFKATADYEKTAAGKISARIEEVRRRLTGAPAPGLKSEFGIADEDLARIQADARRLDASVAAADATRLRSLAFDYCSTPYPTDKEGVSFLHTLAISASDELAAAAAFNPQHGDCLRRLGAEIDERRRLGVRITTSDLLQLSAEYRPLAPLPPALAAPDSARPLPMTVPSGPSDTTDSIANIALRACRGEWPTDDALLDFHRLSRTDAHYLDSLVAGASQGCFQTLLRWILALHRANGSLTLQNLQGEAAPLLPPQAYDGTWEREPRQRPRDCVMRGVWYKECY